MKVAVHVCDYGCGKEAKYQFKNGKWCCEPFWQKCQVKRQKQSVVGKTRRSPEYIEFSGHVCSFGCGRPAHYLFKTGNWCCEERCESCPTKRKENGERKKGHTLSDEHKRKISEGNKGKVVSKVARTNMSNTQRGIIPSKEARRKMSFAHKGNTHSKETIVKMSGRIPWNKGKETSAETKRKQSGAKRYTVKDYQNKFPFFCKVEELQENKITGQIEVYCKNHNCLNSKEMGGRFIPSRLQLYNRRVALENGSDGCYFYCSEGCKNSCDLFNKSAAQLMKQDKTKAGLIEDLGNEGTEIWRQEVFKRNVEEHEKLQCEVCGNINEDELSAHHEKPKKTHPEMSLDPDNGWVLCAFGKGNNCHLDYGHPKNTSCSTGELAKLICERKIK